MKHTQSDLLQMQSLPLSAKIRMTERRIRDWYDYWDGDVYVRFSGGKDSTVLLNIVRNIYPDVEAVFVNTGLEYPEIQQFVKNFDNVTILRPKMRFDEVIKKYGYPVISKVVADAAIQARNSIAKGNYETVRVKQFMGTHMTTDGTKKSQYDKSKYKFLLDAPFKVSDRCCSIMKKAPTKKYENKTGKKPLLGQMASESKKRLEAWKKTGCNAFESNRPQSNPMAFWTDQDVLQYIKKHSLPIASVYGEVIEKDQLQFVGGEMVEQIKMFETGEMLTTTGCNRTGCIFCGFGCHLEKSPNRFERLKKTHPRQYAYCINGGEYNNQGLWQPSKEGLGMGHVFDELNKIYGEDFIKYK